MTGGIARRRGLAFGRVRSRLIRHCQKPFLKSERGPGCLASLRRQDTLVLSAWESIMTGYRMSRGKDVVRDFVWQVIERMGFGRQRRLGILVGWHAGVEGAVLGRRSLGRRGRGALSSSRIRSDRMTDSVDRLSLVGGDSPGRGGHAHAKRQTRQGEAGPVESMGKG
jgi:hypothetical protein